MEKEALYERYEFRTIRPDEAEQTAEIEAVCFSAADACSKEMMYERARRIPELFLTAVDRNTGRIAGFISGIAVNESSFRDEFFSDASLHVPEGRNSMILGLAVLPEHRGQGLARELMVQYLRKERENGRQLVLLTCAQSKVEMYEKMGFCDEGFSGSSWGGKQWHQMCKKNR